MMKAPGTNTNDQDIMDCLQMIIECAAKSSGNHSRRPSSDDMSFDVHEALSDEDMHQVFETAGLNPALDSLESTPVHRSKKRPRENIPSIPSSPKKAKTTVSVREEVEEMDGKISSLENMVIICHPEDLIEQQQDTRPEQCRYLTPEALASALCRSMERLLDKMRMSNMSQKALEEWDRRSGLSKNHSKTMRMSSRSRDRLQSMTFPKKNYWPMMMMPGQY